MLNSGTKYFWCPSTDDARKWNDKSLTNGFGLMMTPATDAHSGWGYVTGEPVLMVNQMQLSYGYNDWGTVNAYVSNNGQLVYYGMGGDCWMQSEPAHHIVAEPNASTVARSADCIIITDVKERFPIPNGIWLMNVDPIHDAEGHPRSDR